MSAGGSEPAAVRDAATAEPLPPDLIDCIARSHVIGWYWPDCSQSRMWIPPWTLELLGYRPGDIEQTVDAFLALVHPEDRGAVEARTREAVVSGRNCHFFDDYRIRSSNGVYLWLRSRTDVVRLPSGTVAAFGMLCLIDREQQLEHSALKFTEDALHTVLNEIGHPVVLMTSDGLVVQANEATARLVAWSTASSLTMHYCPFLHETDGSSVMPGFLDQVVRTGYRAERELMRFGRWWRVYLVPLRIGEEVARILLLAQDITAIKEEQAAQLAREKALTRTLVREVHHRIKNHLQGLVGLLRAYSHSHQSPREAIDAAVAQILSIATVHGLLAKNGQASVELSELVSQIVATVRSVAPIPVQWTTDPVRWQPTSLSQEEAVALAVAIGELLTNAVKHTRNEKGARVEGCLSRVGERIELTIVNAPARLPEGFSSSGRGPHSGLDLVQALLPRDRSQLELSQQGDSVVTRLLYLPEKPLGDATPQAENR